MCNGVIELTKITRIVTRPSIYPWQNGSLAFPWDWDFQGQGCPGCLWCQLQLLGALLRVETNQQA